MFWSCLSRPDVAFVVEWALKAMDYGNTHKNQHFYNWLRLGSVDCCSWLSLGKGDPNLPCEKFPLWQQSVQNKNAKKQIQSSFDGPFHFCLLGCLLGRVYVPCIHRMPGGVIVGDSGLCCCGPAFNVMCDINCSSAITPLFFVLFSF